MSLIGRTTVRGRPIAAASQATADDVAMLAARMDRLPATASIWKLVVLLSLGGFFEFYELFSTAYVVPGIVRSGILKVTTASFFGLNGIASYIGATFAGLFVGTFVFGFIADKCGRRAIFTYSLLWYSACAVASAFQTDALGLNFWRMMTGIGLGVELVTIDAYLSELVPPQVRGRAFALNQVITYSAVPTVAFLAWLLVPLSPLGLDGWRWVMIIGATGALAVWAIRLGLPESPRWLAANGQVGQASSIVDTLEERARHESGAPLAVPIPRFVRLKPGSFRELWSGKYRPRTVMLLLFHAAQSVGLYGFSNWVPTFLMHQGIALAHSLKYTLMIACITPLGPLLALSFADRFERKWQIVSAAILVASAGLAFAEVREPALIILCGCLVTIGATVMSLNFHAYQSELYPTRVRALAVGFVYSASRISGIFSGFLVSFVLAQGGVSAALMLIAGCMAVIVFSISLLGPNTRGRSLEALALDSQGIEVPPQPAHHLQDSTQVQGWVGPALKAATRSDATIGCEFSGYYLEAK
jgi:MFS transporter, putative metabolite:H+ symporter